MLLSALALPAAMSYRPDRPTREVRAETALLIFLRRFAYPARFSDLAHLRTRCSRHLPSVHRYCRGAAVDGGGAFVRDAIVELGRLGGALSLQSS